MSPAFTAMHGGVDSLVSYYAGLTHDDELDDRPLERLDRRTQVAIQLSSSMHDTSHRHL